MEKINYHLLVILIISVLTAGILSVLFGVQEALAYSCVSTKSGNWNVAGTWIGATCNSTYPQPTDTAVISVSHTVTVTADASIAGLTIMGTLTVNSGVTLTDSGNYVCNGTHSGAGATLLNGTATTIGGNGTISATGTFTLTNNKSITGGGFTFSGPTIAISAATTVTNNGTITTSAAGGITGADTTTSVWVNAANSTLNISGPLLSTGTLTASANPNTINYQGGAQTVKATATYHHLTLSGSGTKTLTDTTTAINGNLTLSGTATATTVVGLTIGGNLSVGAGTTFTAAGFDLTITGTTTITGASSNLVINSATGTKIFTGLVTVDTSAVWNNSGNSPVTMRGGLTFNGTTFTAGSGVYTFDTTASQTIGGSSALTIPSITVTSPTVLTNTGTLTTATALSGDGGFTNGDGSTGTLNFGASTLDVTTFTASAAGNTVNYNSTSQAQTVRATTYVNLTITKSGQIATLGGITTVNGTLLISAGTLDVGDGLNYALNLNGDYTNNGTFTARAGTVTLSGSAEQTLSGTMTGTSAFYDLTVTNASSAGVTFADSCAATGTFTDTTQDSKLTFTGGATYTFANIVINGTSGHLIVLTKAGTGQWNFAVPASEVTYVDVEYSNASNTITATTGCYNRGNNTNWVFPATQLGMKTQPGGGTAGTNWATQPEVYVQDASGYTVTTDSTTRVTAAIGTNPGSGTLSGTTTVTAASGVATFTDLNINKSGTGYTLSFTSSPSLTGVTSSAFNITSASLNNFLIEAPATATSGTAFSTTITARDQYNNTTTDVSDSTTLSVDTGNISPSSIAASEFTDDGIYTGNLTISNITEQPTITLTATNGSATGSDTIIVSGVPSAPTIGTPEVLNTTSIRWNFTDNSSYETGFKLYDNTDTEVISSSNTNLTYLDETGLTPSTQYSGRYVKAFNAVGESASSATASATTQSPVSSGGGRPPSRRKAPTPIYKKEIPEEKPIVEIPEIITKIPEIIKEIILPKPPEEIKPPEVPIEELVPKEAPLSMQAKWQLLPSKPIREFVLSPLPKEIRELAEKFPELGETLKKVGITKITDIEKLKTIKLTLPGPTEGKSIPTEVVFARTGAGLIDFNLVLTVSEKGEPQQKITTISGKPLQLTVKPDEPVKSVKGYVVFKSKNPKSEARNPKQIPITQIQNLTASLFFALPSFAKEYNPTEIETKLVLLEFEYTDPDGDGIYTAEIQAPIVEGEYEIITVMDYDDPDLGIKEIRLITVVDPEGYVYEKDGEKETRIPGAIISLFWLNPETKQYELWPAKEYQQENPQITDITGKYSFLVPEGNYYLKVETPGYLVYDGKPFQVKEGSGVHFNIELKTKYWWLKIADWKTILLIVVILLLLYNFYRDKIREKLLRKSKNL